MLSYLGARRRGGTILHGLPDEAPANTLEALKRVERFLRSPVDGSELVVDLAAATMRDTGQGRTYPVLDGIPVLVPDLVDFLRNHYEISRRTGRVPQALAGSLTKLRLRIRFAKLRTYVLGFQLDLIKLGDQLGSPANGYVSGTLFEAENGKPCLVVGDRVVALESFHLKTPYFEAESWPELKRLVGVAPPYFLVSARFPDVLFSNYYEILSYLGRWARDISGSVEATSLPGRNPTESKGELRPPLLPSPPPLEPLTEAIASAP